MKKEYIIGSTTIYPEKNWVKKDIVLYMNMDKPEYMETNQRQAGTNFFRKCDITVQFVQEWYQISSNYCLLDDSPSIMPNIDSFREHRHDQAIFSLLSKKYNIYSSITLRDAVEIIRNKSGHFFFQS